MSRLRQQGFTLLEISIVMVIIALVVGGIVAGRSMIKSSEMIKLHSQVEQLLVGIRTFQGKYQCLPGDCKNATDFFGADDPSICNVVTDGVPMPLDKTIGAGGVCNGDGDGKYDANEGSGITYENVELWRQLGRTKLIPGEYSGSYSSRAQDNMAFRPGYNCPQIQSLPWCWAMFNGDYSMPFKYLYSAPPDLIASALGRPVGNMLWMIAPADQYGWFSATQGQLYEDKYDDGDANSGAVMMNCSEADGNAVDFATILKTRPDEPLCSLIYFTKM